VAKRATSVARSARELLFSSVTGAGQAVGSELRAANTSKHADVVVTTGGGVIFAVAALVGPAGVAKKAVAATSATARHCVVVVRSFLTYLTVRSSSGDAYRAAGSWWADSTGSARTVPGVSDAADVQRDELLGTAGASVGGVAADPVVDAEIQEVEGLDIQDVLVAKPASYVRPTGTLVVYSAKWVPVARYVELVVADLRAAGGVVELVDVDESQDDAENQKILVLPSFVWWGSEGRVLRTGALSPADVAELCGVVLKARR
jgi:hypothetical protein